MGCAQIVPLTGGPKDETPPQLDTLNSMSNYVIHFEKKDILLYFDEYVDLKDAAKQILISPPLSYPPNIQSRLKKVSVVFDEKEVLKEDATYVINFGSSIRDFSEGNELKDFTFVFSTGDFIDSLSVSGTVIDAYTKEPLEDMIVLLYIDHRDSIIYEERPYYFAKTNKEGAFRIENLKSDNFKIVVIEDLNANYLYDPRSERIGFLDSLHTTTPGDSSMLLLEIFRETTRAIYKSYEVLHQGEIKISFESKADPRDIQVLDSIQYFIQHPDPQSHDLILWYRPVGKNQLSWSLWRFDVMDTIHARINIRATDTLSRPLKITQFDHDTKIGLHPDDTLKAHFTYPITGFDNQHIEAIDTTTQDTLKIDWRIDNSPSMVLSGTTRWKPGQVIKITWFPGAIEDFFGHTNDTIREYLHIAPPTEFGDLRITCLDCDGSDLILILMEKEKLIDQKILPAPDSAIVFTHLKPNSYQLIMIEDTNGNGKWDAGNYLQHLQSESVYRPETITIQAGGSNLLELNLLNLRNKAVDQASDIEATPPDSIR